MQLEWINTVYNTCTLIICYASGLAFCHIVIIKFIPKRMTDCYMSILLTGSVQVSVLYQTTLWMLSTHWMFFNSGIEQSTKKLIVINIWLRASTELNKQKFDENPTKKVSEVELCLHIINLKPRTFAWMLVVPVESFTG